MNKFIIGYFCGIGVLLLMNFSGAQIFCHDYCLFDGFFFYPTPSGYVLTEVK